jgi:hypothetical protein
VTSERYRGTEKRRPEVDKALPNKTFGRFADVAQLVEQRFRKPQVVSSSLTVG